MRTNATYPAKTFRSVSGAPNALSPTAIDIAIFDQTQYGYDHDGRQDKVVSPQGTITRSPSRTTRSPPAERPLPTTA